MLDKRAVTTKGIVTPDSERLTPPILASSHVCGSWGDRLILFGLEKRSPPLHQAPTGFESFQEYQSD